MNPLEFNEDRERAQAALERAVGEGRLDLGEFTSLAGVVWDTDDPKVLERITTEAEPAPAAGPAPGTPFAQQPVPVPAATTKPLTGIFGDIERTGGWIVPERTEIQLIFGDAILDLRRATASSPVVYFDIRSLFGSLKVIVPPGVQVETQISTWMGDNKVETSQTAPGAPRVVLTGTSAMGDVKVTTLEVDDEPSFWWRWL